MFCYHSLDQVITKENIFCKFQMKKMLLKICVSLAFFVFAQNVQCNLLAIRQTLNGPIGGIELISSLGQKYVAFKGIRYAMAPVTGTDPLTGDRVDQRFKV